MVFERFNGHLPHFQFKADFSLYFSSQCPVFENIYTFTILNKTYRNHEKKNFQNFVIGLITQSKHRAFRKGNRKISQKIFHDHYCLDGHLRIDDWGFTLFEQCETHKQLKERESLGSTNLKLFTH